jgi:prostatic aicd phosphatase
MLPIFVLLLTFSSSFADEPSPHHQLPSDSIARDPNTIFVLFGTRHGNRNPEKFFEQNEKTWGFEGSSELTKVTLSEIE